MSDRPLVLVTCPQMQRTIDHFRDKLDAAGVNIEMPKVVQALSEAQLLAIIDRYDGMIAGDDELTAAVIAKAERLRVIAKWGVGVDGIDRSAADANGIVVTNTPGVFGEEVADVALSYVLLLARRVHEIDRSVRAGGWTKPVGMTLAGKTMGVIGLGSIGRATIRRAVAFGMDVVGYDPVEAQHAAARELGVEPLPLDELLTCSRFVVLCCPLTADNRHLISTDELEAMRDDAFLVNVARGPLVDERALEQALADGRIAGAGLDTFEVEPLPSDSALRDFPTVILGSHNGSNTEEGTLRVSAMAVDNLIRELHLTRGGGGPARPVESS